MANEGLAQTAGVVVLCGILLAAAASLQATREQNFPPRDQEQSLYLRSGPAIRRLAGAYTLMAADVYWIRAIQYYGGIKQTIAADQRWPEPPPSIEKLPDNYQLLYPLLDITTTLDPLFTIAYRFGAVFLAEAQPRGAGRPDLAATLLQKGLRARPDRWEYLQDIGFVNYWYLHDYEAAASWFVKASAIPGAPWWLKSLAATTLAQGGDREPSRAMWESIRQAADNDWLRQDAERRLLQLRALDEIDLLQRRLDEYRARFGQRAQGWDVLIRAGLIAGVPLDPTRTPYEIAPDGHVGLSKTSALFPLPTEPDRLAVPPS